MQQNIDILKMESYNEKNLKDGDLMAGYYDEEGAPRALGAAIDTGKPAVLLIGDSIRMGYCQTVRNSLSDQADVYYPEENCRFSQFIFASLSSWVNLVPDPDRVVLVHWNCGHWDIAHFRGSPEPLNSLSVYRSMLQQIQKDLKKEFPNAKIVFATTTPMNPSGEQGVNIRSTQEIIQYNQAAKKIILQEGGLIDDLFDVMQDKDASWYEDYCHYTPDGFVYLGQKVADYIRQNL